MPELDRAARREPPFDADRIRARLRAEPGLLHDDPALLAELGLRPAVANVVDFGPIALSRVSAAHQREAGERRRLEVLARVNYEAQAQTHAAVLDVLEARDHADLASRVDALSRRRLGLAAGRLALEGPGEIPAGWLPLVQGQADLILGARRQARLGPAATSVGLFGEAAPTIRSVAVVRLSPRTVQRQGVIAFGAADPGAFSDEMGEDLVAFVARVIERTVERWPIA